MHFLKLGSRPLGGLLPSSELPPPSLAAEAANWGVFLEGTPPAFQHWGGSAKGTAPLPDSCLSPGARRPQAGPDAPPLREDTRGRETARRSFQERTKGPKDGQRRPRASRRASGRLPLTGGSCCEHCPGISRGKKCLKWPSGTTPETADMLAWAEGVERLWAAALARPDSAPHDGADQSGWTSAPSPAASQARRCCWDFPLSPDDTCQAPSLIQLNELLDTRWLRE